MGLGAKSNFKCLNLQLNPLQRVPLQLERW